MRRHGVKMLVVACNTASSVAMEAAGERRPVCRWSGVIEPGAQPRRRASFALGRIG